MTFSHIFTHYFIEFCRDRRLRTFLKVVQKNLQHTCSKQGGGAQRPFEQCSKKLHYWYSKASLTVGSMFIAPIISRETVWSGRYLGGCVWASFAQLAEMPEPEVGSLDPLPCSVPAWTPLPCSSSNAALHPAPMVQPAPNSLGGAAASC